MLFAKYKSVIDFLFKKMCSFCLHTYSIFIIGISGIELIATLVHALLQLPNESSFQNKKAHITNTDHICIKIVH